MPLRNLLSGKSTNAVIRACVTHVSHCKIYVGSVRWRIVFTKSNAHLSFVSNTLQPGRLVVYLLCCPTTDHYRIIRLWLKHNWWPKETQLTAATPNRIDRMAIMRRRIQVLRPYNAHVRRIRSTWVTLSPTVILLMTVTHHRQMSGWLL